MTTFNDDENVKMMRDTARELGLTDLLVSILQSPEPMADADVARLDLALDLLGVSDDDLRSDAGRPERGGQ